MHNGSFGLPLPARISALSLILLVATGSPAAAKPEIREGFFLAYPSAVGSVLDQVPSNPTHCGVCHYRFNGGGTRNPFGVAVQNRLPGFPNTPEGRRDAILSLGSQDSDGDSYSNTLEITDLAHYTNTPTFPGLTAQNVGNVSQVNVAEIQGHLTPIPGTDTIPPAVVVQSPNGGESWTGHGAHAITWNATDAGGVVRVDLYFTTDGGATFQPLALGLANLGTFTWFVPDFPGGNTLVRVDAFDPSNNRGTDASNGPFAIVGPSGSRVPTTLRDFHLPGTQPLGAGITQPHTDCSNCHGNYDPDIEPDFTWKGSLMAQAARDPLFYAAVAIANQDARDSGDLCLRCHTPPGWYGGHSTPPDGSQLTAVDRDGVTCDACHGMVDPIYEAGTSPLEDLAILSALAEIPPATANGMLVLDPSSAKRGPFSDAQSPGHAIIPSPFHREAAFCGTCHNVSNPAFSRSGTRYTLNALDAAPPSQDPYEQFPVERTYAEWLMSAYNTPGGIYQPEFAGARPDGRVSTCQDCHLRDAIGVGSTVPNSPLRPDLPIHDFTGGNTWMATIIPELYPGEVDENAMIVAADRALYMLSYAATLEVELDQIGNTPTAVVTVTNQTGHKLPTGYPEGRRMWIQLKAFNAQDGLVYESGAYNLKTGELTFDPDLRIYQSELGISSALTGVLGLPRGPSFHFVLNDSVCLDNRIPPRGFTNAGFAQVQAAPVDPAWPGPGPRYADGQHWDSATYDLPGPTVRVEVTLYYQTTSKDYVTFLQEENTTGTIGDVMFAAWESHGRAAPIAMATAEAVLTVGVPAADGAPPLAFGLARPAPNPFSEEVRLAYHLDRSGPVSLAVHDIAGRRVRTLVSAGGVAAGAHALVWDGRDPGGRRLPAGIYWLRLESRGRVEVQRLVIVH